MQKKKKEILLKVPKTVPFRGACKVQSQKIYYGSKLNILITSTALKFVK